MTYILGEKSLRELTGVHPKLVEVVKKAIQITTQDFTVYDGLRTEAEQRLNLARGVSKTTDSYHIKQADGWGHAADLVPLIGGVLKWDWEGCYRIFLAMDSAATSLGVADKITWGGVWDRTLAQITSLNEQQVKAAVYAYTERHPGKDFLDGPHFQLAR